MKRKYSAPTIFILISAAALVALVVLTWFNYRFADENPGGNDFLVHWVGTRSLVTEGLNPYSDAVATQIQQRAYGRAARAGEHELRVAYPLYSVVFFLPFALVGDFTLARAMWMTLLEVSLVGLAFLSLRLARWRINPIMLALLLIFSILWYHGLRPLINGNAVVLVALGLAGGFIALRAGADELAGVLLAFTTIKPQVVILVLAFVVLWSISHGRWRVVMWMTATVILLAASAALLIPSWMLDNLREVIAYPGYNPPGTPRAAFITWWPDWGGRLGLVLSAIMAVILLVEWWSNRKSEFQGFLWTVCLTLVISQWIGIQTDPGNFVVLFPALILVFSLMDDRWRTGGKMFVILSMVLLFFGIWAIFLTTVQAGDQPQQSPIMFFPLPAYLLMMLYWVRWWAIEPPTVWYDQLEGR